MPDSSENKNAGRILVFVVAFEAERHLVDTFARIPEGVLRDPGVDFVCIDDASQDAGSAMLARWAEERDLEGVAVMRNPVNQGYGGNQKLGYRLAIDRGYDFVILLHGDGQYAPELLSRFVDTWREQRADVVLGSRMAEPGLARRGGMPAYKWLGNRTLTSFQNVVTGLELSEYHTGYRGYSTEFLSRVPFEANTNDFHFDTEILLQAAHLGARIVEFPIPTRYGNEVCHVPGVDYGVNVVKATTQFRLHQLGVLCSLKYRDLGTSPYGDKTQMLYSSHRLALGWVRRRGMRRILDIGCGPGQVARECRRLGAEVVGLDGREPLPDAVDEFHRVDLDSEELPVDPSGFDGVRMLDVIEHLSEPEEFLLSLRNQGGGRAYDRPAPTMIVSTPNVAFAAVRFALLFGRLAYADRGILDVTHKRLFTRSSLVGTLRSCGYEIESVEPVPAPVEVVRPGRVGRILTRFTTALAKLWPTMFAFQFLVVCRPRPGVNQILAASEHHYAGARARVHEASRDGAQAAVSGSAATAEDG
jgi:SAM-dependent methyltransferase